MLTASQVIVYSISPWNSQEIAASDSASLVHSITLIATDCYESSATHGGDNTIITCRIVGQLGPMIELSQVNLLKHTSKR